MSIEGYEVVTHPVLTDGTEMNISGLGGSSLVESADMPPIPSQISDNLNDSPERKPYNAEIGRDLVIVFLRALEEQSRPIKEGLTIKELYTQLKQFCVGSVDEDANEYESKDTIEKSGIFFKTDTDGRAYRVIVKDHGKGTASRKLIESIWVSFGKGRLLVNETYPEMMFTIKGGGANHKTMQEAEETWRPKAQRPLGLTALDKTDNQVARAIGYGQASRVLVGAVELESLSSNDQVTILDEVTGDESNPLVVELFAAPGGFCTRDIKNDEANKVYDLNKLIEQAIYFFPDILNDLRGDKLSNVEKKVLIGQRLAQKYIVDFSKIANNFIVGENRSSHNTTIFGQQDFDDTLMRINVYDETKLQSFELLLDSQISYIREVVDDYVYGSIIEELFGYLEKCFTEQNIKDDSKNEGFGYFKHQIAKVLIQNSDDQGTGIRLNNLIINNFTELCEYSFYYIVLFTQCSADQIIELELIDKYRIWNKDKDASESLVKKFDNNDLRNQLLKKIKEIAQNHDFDSSDESFTKFLFNLIVVSDNEYLNSSIYSYYKDWLLSLTEVDKSSMFNSFINYAGKDDISAILKKFGLANMSYEQIWGILRKANGESEKNNEIKDIIQEHIKSNGVELDLNTILHNNSVQSCAQMILEAFGPDKKNNYEGINLPKIKQNRLIRALSKIISRLS